VLALAIILAPSANAASFTLSEALALAYETNPQLDSARAVLESLDQGVAQADAGWRPTVSASGSYGLERGTVQGIAAPFNSYPLIGQVTVSEPVFRGGRTFAEIGHAISLVRAGRAQLTATEESVLLSAVTAYMDVVRDSTSVELGRENVRTLESELKAVTSELAAGAVTHTDELQAEARLARAKSDLAVADLNLAASRAEFESVIGRPAESLEDAPPMPRLPATTDEALSLALRLNPNLVAAKENIRAADYAVDDAAGALLPEVSVSGQYQYLRDAAGTNIFATKSPQQILSVLGQVSIPIYQGGDDEATVRRAKDVLHRYELDSVTAERGVRQNVETSWQALLSEKLALAASDAEAQADQAAVGGVSQERQGGERSELDVLNAQQEYINARIAANVARHDYIIAAFRVLSATGQLTARDLGLAVKLYDPRTHYEENAHAWFGFGE